MKQGIPKPVQELLARQTAGDEHPSADLLNGYLEQSLTASETARLTKHLTVCKDCREIVFLASAVEEAVPAVAAAMPAQPQVAATILRPRSRRAWWKWSIPAVAVVALAFGVLIERDRIPRRQRPGSEAAIALNRPAPSIAAGNQSKVELGEPKPAFEPRALHANPTQSKKHAVLQERQNESTEQARRIAQEQTRRNAMEMAQLSPSLEKPRPTALAGAVVPSRPPAVTPPPKAAPPRSTSQSVAVTSASPLVQADNADLLTNSDQNLVANTPKGANDLSNIQPSAGGSGSGQGGKDQTTPAASLKSGLLSSGQPAAVSKLAKAEFARARWRIGADGHLERALPGSAWTRVLANQPVAFRAVATVGSNVWAGGNRGALFHSTDQGENWNQVALNSNGRPEGSAVVSIHFDTAMQGNLSTASGATWVTSDGGQTWIRR